MEGKDGLRDGGKEEAAGSDAAVAGINSLLRSLTLLSLKGPFKLMTSGTILASWRPLPLVCKFTFRI